MPTSLSSLLPPGIAGFEASRQIGRQGEASDLNRLSGILQLQAALMQQQQFREQIAERARVQALLPQLNQAMQSGDRNQILGILAQMPGQAGAAAGLAIPKPRDFMNVAPGASVFDPNTGKPLFTAPAKPETPQSGVGKLRADLAAGRISQEEYNEAYKKAVTFPPPVQVSLGSPVAAIDTDPNSPTYGQPVLVQPANKPGQPPQRLPGFAPQPKKLEERGLTPENAGKVAMARQAVSAINTVKKYVFNQAGGINRALLAGMAIPGTAGTPLDSNARIARSAMRNAVEAKLRLETGAAATEAEVNRTLDRFMPSALDTPESAAFKLNELQKFFQDALSEVKGLKTPQAASGATTNVAPLQRWKIEKVNP